MKYCDHDFRLYVFNATLYRPTIMLMKNRVAEELEQSSGLRQLTTDKVFPSRLVQSA